TVQERPMRILSLLAALLVTGVPSVSAGGTDLTKIDRSIKKEPAYRGKPKYCLLVFGPQAQTRVWLVLDGQTLYVDRKGDGDLTAAGNRVANISKRPKMARFRVTGNFAPVPARTDFFMVVDARGDLVTIDFRVYEGKGNYPRRLATEEEDFRFSDRPQDAPI